MIASLDKYGRIIIPKKVRERLGITPKTGLNIEEDGKRIIIEPIQKEEAVVEKDGILIYTGKLRGEPDKLLKGDRAQRMSNLLGKK